MEGEIEAMKGVDTFSGLKDYVVGYVPAGCKLIDHAGHLWIVWPNGKQEPLPKKKPADGEGQ